MSRHVESHNPNHSVIEQSISSAGHGAFVDTDRVCNPLPRGSPIDVQRFKDLLIGDVFRHSLPHFVHVSATGLS